MFCVGLLILAAARSVAISSTARNTKFMWPIADAMGMPDAESRLSSGIQVFFGDGVHPAAAKSFGARTSIKKTSGTNQERPRLTFQGEAVILE